MKNKAVLSIVGFRGINNVEQLTVLTVEGNSDWYELPTLFLDKTEDVDESINCELQRIVGFKVNEGAIIPVKIYSFKETDGICMFHSYAVVLPPWSNRPRGTNLMLYNQTDRRLAEQLAGNQDTIFYDALNAIRTRLVSPQELPGLTSEMKNKFWEVLVSPSERKIWATGLSSLGIKDNSGKYVYNYLHPCLSCDALVFSVTDTSELVIPLIQRANTGTGDGEWALPGGFVEKEDFEKAEWEEGKEFKYDKKQNYLDYMKDGKSVVDVATKRILKDKTGICLPEDADLYPLSVPCQDNPRHGWTDGAPIISRSYLTVLGNYASNIHLHFTSDKVQDVRWFKIRRTLYNAQGEIVVREGGNVNSKNARIIGKDSEFDLSYNPSLSDVYINVKDGILYIDHFQGDARTNREGRYSSEIKEIFAHHGEVVVAALEYMKSSLYTSNILPEFLISDPEKPWSDEVNSFSMDRFKKVLASISCFEVECRQNLYDKVVLLTKNGKENNGFLSAVGRESYCLDKERFARFCYKRTRKL